MNIYLAYNDVLLLLLICFYLQSIGGESTFLYEVIFGYKQIFWEKKTCLRIDAFIVITVTDISLNAYVKIFSCDLVL